jgi:photosystem II stability/assembly factor-like uncharacterized protein
MLIGSPAAHAQSEPLTPPAVMSTKAQHNLLLDVARAGDRLVAVGEYGHILYSDDDGKQWHQVQVPVSSTLNAVHFADAQHGWAVGHEGVVLATQDGGLSWQQQLNGLQINQIGIEHTEQAMAQEPDENDHLPGTHPDLIVDDVDFLAGDALSFADEGASRPLFDVWFKNAKEGFITGAYGIILHTTDGGNSWQSLMTQVYNVDNFHYYQTVPASGDTLFLIGEAGLLHRSDDGGQSWTQLESPYEGTFFGGVFNQQTGDLLVFGLRGNLFKSSDLGETWQQLDNPTTATLASGLIQADGSYLLVGHGGTQLTIDPQSYQVQVAHSARRAPLSAVALTTSGQRVYAGLAGIELNGQTAAAGE